MVRLSLILVTLSWVLMFSVPATAQTGPSAGSAQYDQYDEPGDGVGDRAARDAITAWDAIRAGSTEARDGDVASAEETPDESTEDSGSAEESPDEDTDASGPEELPDTGGPSPLWALLPLLGAGGLLARRILAP